MYVCCDNCYSARRVYQNAGTTNQAAQECYKVEEFVLDKASGCSCVVYSLCVLSVELSLGTMFGTLGL